MKKLMNEITGKKNESNDSEKLFSNVNIMNKVELDKLQNHNLSIYY